ncbi:hypothetical protein MRB53_016470 [Persea americana]|uniref:Uncharacterized protein n=1 Tax=Persea americana TaxID=3435 RepID=A0ACC2M1W8_PERAE|nr:hypothetical protein MRB53_016470 [Persea americana]
MPRPVTTHLVFFNLQRHFLTSSFPSKPSIFPSVATCDEPLENMAGGEKEKDEKNVDDLDCIILEFDPLENICPSFEEEAFHRRQTLSRRRRPSNHLRTRPGEETPQFFFGQRLEPSKTLRHRGDQRNNAQKNLQESDGFTIVDKGRKSPSPSKASKESENSDPNRFQCLSNLDGNSQVEENEIIDTTSLIERVVSSSSGVGTCSYLGSDNGKAVGANFASGSNRSSRGIVIRGEPQQTKRV